MNSPEISFAIKAVDKANQGFNLGIYNAELLTYEPGANGVAVKKAGNVYTTNIVQVNSPEISFAIKAVDKANQGFNLGIYNAELL
ncbi:hypothetical protein BOQ60_26100, partial [Chryseobacterium sp. CH1]